MNAREKAKELFDKFYPRATSYSSDRKNQKENGKECSLIAIDLVIEQIYNSGEMSANAQIEWWNRVKAELQSL
jgi:hypothetical protein